jgi:crotonobetainyl-CoA:carnitine CoA-transferase CaiB-like acyl-CoA transferase
MHSLGRPDVADLPQYANSRARRDNRQTLLPLIAEILRTDTRENWLRKMHAEGVPVGAIRTVGEALEAPEIRHLGLLSTIPHPTLGTVPNVGLPIRFSETPVAAPVAAPRLGAQTDEILSTILGYDARRIAALARDGALGADRRAAQKVPGDQ